LLAATGTGLIKQLVSPGGATAGPIASDVFYPLTAFRTKILTRKDRTAAIGAILGRSFFFSDQRITAPLTEAVFITVNGMALRADSHKSKFP
jgi:hypothetical protein